jgi:GH24 family phage-related lysozyme (muramidase)
MASVLAGAAAFVLVLATGAAAEPTRAEAQAVFARFRGMAGEWEGKSTRGWTDRVTVRAIAGGSVVVHNSFEAHPGEEMMTAYHMHGDRLLLTHYCMAKNQPRLVLSAVEEDGRRAVFTFLDATGIPTRDAGHMDKAVYEFTAEDRYTARWTWYQDGKESWLEEIEMRRVPARAAR